MMAGNSTIVDPRDDVLGRSRVTDTPELEAFYQELAGHNAGAFWKRANAIEPWEPETRYRPTLWRYAEMRDMCLRALDLVKPEEAGRRVVTLLNDSDAGRENVAVCGWLFSGMQAMRPGEITPAHKHTASAHRFIMEGKGAYTVVDGHHITLGANDYVLTPNGAWHDHGVLAGGEVSIWQDGLDIPLMNSLETNFYAVYDQPAQTAAFPVDDLPLSYGGAGLRPEGVPAWEKPYSPVLVYRWEATRDALWNLAKVSEGTPFDGHMVRYSNPLTGGWALQTMGAHMQMLKGGFRGKAHRHTGNVVYNVAGGRGYSIIGGERFDWATHDIFCVPAWMWHEHVNLDASEEAFLFSFNDFPVMEALGVRIEEPYSENGGHQPA
ncbi:MULTISPECIES: cupin domain-containing protein [unclassified Sphingopyxis]|jgi:gentisate 1,2-dioxygenase|uniref:cupin domain-containing protein n=1 Tax=unclassified Sphingopyxis TaxID=2614943 RepID=UPI00050E5C54|nr:MULTISPECIES: cupin domain-containing protein [unclassified Sphingopyxis]KGB51532.1 Gentisate 1,2-dioxygenase [Sphingopyxis sp. LC363]